ncbi:conserved Plasmodium protein, unknown function [Plasmodium gallinaceum]|uniref:Merozoite surface protein 10 n=1 Tax=Plasmodium gallinaceum TaxID=5849 RepID=A0A1J1GNM5_PLAGA|nr:conserved Plasmodium protein, unknown function [Plasmodium gallinaceum]CRG94081.1 conserved Plasmodium protein, unknown function [Plasmodium gallinaceum]
MSSMLLWILTFAFFFNLICSLIASNLTTLKDEDFEIIYESHSRNLVILSQNPKKCNNDTYYINDECKIINPQIKVNMNNVETCLNKNKCSHVAKYIFENINIDITSEQIFSKKLPCNNESDEKNYECNKELFINENMKCMCCKKELSDFIKDETDNNVYEKCKNYNQYVFTDCKCLLKNVANDSNIYINNCENFTCNGGLCTLKTNGDPFCSCFDKYYFDMKKNACVKHEDENDILLYKDKNNNSEENHKNTSTINESSSNDNPVNSLTTSLTKNRENELIDNGNKKKTINNSCSKNHIKNKHGICEQKNILEESVCLRIECFNDHEKSECFCLNKNGEKIDYNTFDVSYISTCTLNNINCDNGKCNNSLKKDKLGCICDENYIYDNDLRVCINFSLRTFLNFTIIIAIYAIMSIIC